MESGPLASGALGECLVVTPSRGSSAAHIHMTACTSSFAVHRRSARIVKGTTHMCRARGTCARRLPGQLGRAPGLRARTGQAGQRRAPGTLPACSSRAAGARHLRSARGAPHAVQRLVVVLADVHLHAAAGVFQQQADHQAARP